MFFIGKRLSVKSITFYFSVVASFVFFTMLSDCFTSKQFLNYGEKQIQRSLRGEASKAGILTMNRPVRWTKRPGKRLSVFCCN